MRLKLHNTTKNIFSFVILFLMAFSLNAQYGENEGINSDFSGGEDNWSFTVRNGYAATFAVSTGEAVVSVTQNDDDNKGKIFLTNDRISGVSPTHQYKVSIKAKADVAGKVISLKVLAYDADGNKKSRSSEDIALTTEFETYNWIYNSNPDYIEEMEVIVRFHNVSVVTFDDVTIQKINGVANGTFDESELHPFGWGESVTDDYGAAATFAYDESDPYAGSKALKVDVTVDDDTASHISFDSETKLWIDNTKEYALTFYAKGDDGDTIVPNLQLFGLSGSFAASQPDTVEITDTYEMYAVTYEFVDTILFIKAKLFFGLNEGTYFVDNVSFFEVSDLSITSTAVTTATVGELYEYQAVADGEGTWSLETDVTADWLSIDASGKVSGTPDAEGNVEVTITIDNGIKSATQTYTLSVNPTGINAYGQNNIEIYPNPASEYVTLRNLEEGSTLTILDITGKEVKHISVNGSEMIVPLDDMSGGIYFLRTGKEYKVEKLIIR